VRQHSWYSNSLPTEQYRPTHTSYKTHTASCTMGTRSNSQWNGGGGVQPGCGAAHPLLMPRSSTCRHVELYFYLPSVPASKIMRKTLSSLLQQLGWGFSKYCTTVGCNAAMIHQLCTKHIRKVSTICEHFRHSSKVMISHVCAIFPHSLTSHRREYEKIRKCLWIVLYV
jgi:hypothetical protein